MSRSGVFVAAGLILTVLVGISGCGTRTSETSAGASQGNTGVFVNGRQLSSAQVARLRQLVPVTPGRYTLDTHGNMGLEGGPPQVNLVQIAQQRAAHHNAAAQGRQGQQSHTHRSNVTDIGVSSSGDFVGIIGRDFSVITGN